MIFVLGYESALEYWREPGASVTRMERSSWPAKSKRMGRRQGLQHCSLTKPLQVLARNHAERSNQPNLVYHIWGGPCLGSSFCHAEKHWWVSSPEFVFLQMATQMSMHQLIQLGFELCGTYSLVERGEGLTPRNEPLTSKAQLQRFIAQVKSLASQQRELGKLWRHIGIPRAEQALKYVLDGSASPMESLLATILTLPYRLGGYGFQAPEMNVRIDVSSSQKRASRKRYYVCDLYWPEQRLAIEYDSTMFHTGADHIAEDAEKRNALAYCGIELITLTSRQFLRPEDFERSAQLIAKKLGKRLRPPQEFSSRRNELLRLRFN